MIVTTGDRGNPVAAIELFLPKRNAGGRAFGDNSVDGFDGLDQMHIGRRFWIPAAAQAGFPGGVFRMIDRNQSASGMDFLQQRVPRRNLGAADAKIEEVGRAKDIRVPLKGGQFAPRNQQDIIEIGLQFPHCIVLRHGVVICDGNEIEPSLRGRLDGEEHRAGYGLAVLTFAAAVAVRGMHVEVAAIPSRLLADHRVDIRGSLLRAARARKINFRRVGSGHVWPDVGNSHQQIPSSGDDFAGKIRRCGVSLRDHNRARPSAAPTAQSARTNQAQVDDGLLLGAGVRKLHRDPLYARRNGEGDELVGKIVFASDGAAQQAIRRDLGIQIPRAPHREGSKQPAGPSPVMEHFAAQKHRSIGKQLPHPTARAAESYHCGTNMVTSS